MNQVDPSLPTHRDDGGIRSTLPQETRKSISEDPVGRVLRWVLLATAIVCFAMIGWATVRTYRDSPQIPTRFTGADGTVVMTGADIVEGKSGFQKADPMDYGSLYGMGSYFGPDYTAQILVAIASAAENAIALGKTGKNFATLPPDQQSAIRVQMQAALHQIDLTHDVVTLPDPLARALITVRDDVAAKLRQDDVAAGYSRARSLDAETAQQTADFLLYSALTTVSWRPGSTVSWTQNWPYEPIVNNAPTSATFIWTWASFCFVFLGFGAVLFIYKVFLSDADLEPKDPVLYFLQRLRDEAHRFAIGSHRARRAKAIGTSPLAYPLTAVPTPEGTNLAQGMALYAGVVPAPLDSDITNCAILAYYRDPNGKDALVRADEVLKITEL